MNKIVDNNLDIKNDRVLVDFSASWCGPCKMLSLVLDKVEDEKLIDIYNFDIDENDKLADEYKIYSVPTLIIFENKSHFQLCFAVSLTNTLSNGFNVLGSNFVFLYQGAVNLDQSRCSRDGNKIHSESCLLMR